LFSAKAKQAFDFGAGFAQAFLDAPDQFVFLTLRKPKIVVRELAEFLFQAAFDNVPFALHFEFVHITSA
jgi:hypothetical protein